MIFRIYFWILSQRLIKWLNKEFKTNEFKFYNMKDLFYYYCLWKNRKKHHFKPKFSKTFFK